MLNKKQIPMFKHKRRICKVLMKKEIIVLTYKIFQYSLHNVEKRYIIDNQ